MTSLTLQLDNDLCSTKSDCDTSEQIIKLFPKCRPRSDVNLNPILITSQEHECTDNAVSNSVMSTERNTDRIIEIAGGREIFSQSRSKAARSKSRNVYSSDDYDKKKVTKSPISQGIWEVRGTYGEVKKVKAANDFTETIFSTEISSVRHQKTDKHGNCLGSNKRSSPNQNETVVNNRDIVVFDDIDESWKDRQVDYIENNKSKVNDINLYENSSIATSPISPISHQQNFSDFFKGMISDLDETPESEVDNKITKVIGNLPIAVYEGSPKRYGLRHADNIQSQHPALPSAHSLLASPSVYPPRPGFPQRVICTPTESDGMIEMPVANVDNTTSATTTSTFDYLYEFSETRKVLEEFFKYPSEEEKRYESDFQDLDYELRRQTNGDGSGSSYVGQRLAKCVGVEQNDIYEHEVLEHENNFIDLSVGTGSSGDLGETEVGLQVGHSRNFTLSPETTDCDSNCGDLDSEVSLMLMDELVPSVGLLGSTELGVPADSTRLYSSMPVLEDGLSSGHASDTDNNNPTVMLMKKQINEIEREIIHKAHNDTNIRNKHSDVNAKQENGIINNKDNLNILSSSTPIEMFNSCGVKNITQFTDSDIKENHMDSMVTASDITPPPPAPAPHRSLNDMECHQNDEVEAAIKDIRLTLQRTKVLPVKSNVSEDCQENTISPVWVPRQRGLSGTSADSDTKKPQSSEEQVDEEEADTDLETDRLLGQQRTDDQGFYDDKGWRKPKSRTIMPTNSIQKNIPTTPNQIVPVASKQILSSTCDTNISDIPISSPPCSPMARDSGSDKTSSPQSQKGSTSSAKLKDKESKKKSRNKEVLIEGVLFRARYLGSTQLVCEGQPTKTTRMMQAEEAVSRIKEAAGNQIEKSNESLEVEACNESVAVHDNIMTKNYVDMRACAPILGVGSTGTMFRLQFLGSVEVEAEGGKKRKKRMKKNMVEEAVIKIKALAPDGETQPSTEVDLFISTEKIMVLNTDLKEIMMDHALRTISYIADIGDLVVLMARRRFVPHEMEDPPKINRTPKMICHVFESDEAQFIAQSIGQAFQVAYMEFLKANGIEDHSFVKEMDYQEVLNSQEIFGDELQMFAKKEMQKEVVVPKAKGEILGVVIVESGWGSMLPTVVIANLAPAGAAARCGQLNIGDQIIAINGVSLVGLPLSTCQNYIKNSKNQTVVKLTVVPCAPVVEVKIKRPDTKYQLGFSVQNGVICSLLRGGIAERGGVRVGHRIIEINNQSVVAVPHEKIVNLLATSVGEILMKTMPTSMFRLLTGQENPVYI